MRHRAVRPPCPPVHSVTVHWTLSTDRTCCNCNIKAHVFGCIPPPLSSGVEKAKYISISHGFMGICWAYFGTPLQRSGRSLTWLISFFFQIPSNAGDRSDSLEGEKCSSTLIKFQCFFDFAPLLTPRKFSHGCVRSPSINPSIIFPGQIGVFEMT